MLFVLAWLPDLPTEPLSIMTNSGSLLDMMEMPGKYLFLHCRMHSISQQSQTNVLQSRMLGFFLDVVNMHN